MNGECQYQGGLEARFQLSMTCGAKTTTKLTFFFHHLAETFKATAAEKMRTASLITLKADGCRNVLISNVVVVVTSQAG